MRVVVLMGGSSMERDVSLATGRGVARALSARGHAVVPLDPSAGRRLELDHLAQHRIGEAPPEEAEERSLVLADNPEIGKCDAVFVALHGGIGEDGTLQALLDLAQEVGFAEGGIDAEGAGDGAIEVENAAGGLRDVGDQEGGLAQRLDEGAQQRGLAHTGSGDQ